MKVDKKVLKRVVKVLLNKLPKEENVLLEVANQLDLLKVIYKKDQNFRNFLLDPNIPYEKKVQVVEKIGETLKLNDVVQEAIKYLVKINKANLLKSLADEFRFEVEKFFATVQGEIISAFDLEKEDVEEIKNILEKKIGKKVEFELKKDPSIIGGVIIKAGSYMIDASVKTFLKKLAYQITK